MIPWIQNIWNGWVPRSKKDRTCIVPMEVIWPCGTTRKPIWKEWYPGSGKLIRRRIEHCEFWILSAVYFFELWTLNFELWTMNFELWTLNYELWTGIFLYASVACKCSATAFIILFIRMAELSSLALGKIKWSEPLEMILFPGREFKRFSFK